ncbi:MAG: lysylphosphatidylglycerol synthase transmembrane domain-containing protein [Thermodesulfobacteriota bacterium]
MQTRSRQSGGIYIKIRVILLLVGIMLMGVILYRVDWYYLGVSFRELHIKCLFLSAPFFICTIWIKSLRWLYMVRIQGIKLFKWQAFMYYAAAMFWGVVTPGRAGEGIKIFYLKEHGVTSGKATLSVILDRIFDVFFLVIFSIAGIMVVQNVFSWSINVVFIFCFILLFWNWKVIFRKIKRPILFITPKKYKENVNIFFNEASADLPLFSLRKMLGVTVFTSLSWISYVIPLYILGRGLGLQVSYSVLITAILLSSAISMLPVSIAGIGTRDGFLILYLGQAGVSKEVSILFSAMFIYMNIIAIVVGYLAYIQKDVKTFIRERK